MLYVICQVCYILYIKYIREVLIQLYGHFGSQRHVKRGSSKHVAVSVNHLKLLWEFECYKNLKQILCFKVSFYHGTFTKQRVHTQSLSNFQLSDMSRQVVIYANIHGYTPGLMLQCFTHF